MGIDGKSILGIVSKKTTDAYEREIEYLKAQLMRSETRSTVINPKSRAFEESLSKWRFSNKILNEYIHVHLSSSLTSLPFRSDGSRSFFTRLKHELIRMNALTSEANTIASEMQRQTTYTVMLQIPVSYLKPSERVGDRDGIDNRWRNVCSRQQRISVSQRFK